MKKYIYVLLFILISYTSYSQINDTAFAAVRYTFVYLSDTSMPAETETMVLFLGNKTSEYKSYDRFLYDSLIKTQIEKYKNAPMEGTPIVIGAAGMKRGNGAIIYKDISSTKMRRIENFMKNYLIDEEMPTINWSMTEETKNIQELNCQKATATFRGRNYTAWFTSQLPYSNGPWKLGGLPGLIVEACDDQQQVVFKFAGFENVSHRQLPITLPKDFVKATDKEYKQLRESAEKDPQGFMKSRMAEMQGSNMTVTPVTGVGAVSFASGGVSRTAGTTPTKRRVLNNPIERSPL